jgi:polyphosphate kinase 2 (PPK2 family)
MTPVDERAQELWDKYTEYKNKMFENTKKGVVDWQIIKANRKTFARISAMNHILESIPYDPERPV